MTNTNVRIRNHLFRLRRIRGWTQQQLALLLGLRCSKAVSAMERGLRLPTLKVALTMEVVFGTRLSDIYPDLCAYLAEAAMLREERLPKRFTRHIRGRVLRKD